MSFQADLVTYLNTIGALTALVSTRIYPQVAPKAADRVALTMAETPYIVFTQVSGPGSHHMEGISGQRRPLYQFSCFAATDSVARAVAAALKTALDGYSGSMGTGPTVVQGSLLRNERDVPSIEADEDLASMRAVQQDYEIWQRE